MPSYVEREIKPYFDKIKEHYPIIALVGPRQAGKTTFLKEQAKGINAKYVLFDDPDARNMFEEDIKKFERQYVFGNDVTILDEVHYCENAGRNLKYLADTGHRLWITSSSELILAKAVLAYLVGRVSIIKLYPFSLNELLAARGQKEFTDEIMRRLIWEHSVYGGYPRIIFTDDVEVKKIILRDLYQTILLKDIAQNFTIDDLKSLEQFTIYLSRLIGGLVSYNDISRSIGMSFQSLKKYLDAMEKSNLLYVAAPFYKNKIKEIIKQPKVFFIDTGLRNSVVKEFRDELSGELFENQVLSELVKKGFAPKYWRTKAGAEVDFVIEDGDKVIPIEVKLTSPKIIERSLASFIDEYRPKRAFIVYYKGRSMERMRKGCTVYFVNLNRLIGMLS